VVPVWQQRGQKLFTNHAEFEQRAEYKYNKLQDLIAAYAETHNETQRDKNAT